jgi:hypothetical protein
MNAPLARETQAAALLKTRYQEIADDADAVRDLIEGQTSLHELLEIVLRAVLDDQALSAAIGERIKALQERKKRIDLRIERQREMCEAAMDVAELPSLALPECTAIMARRPAKVSITDPEELPEAFVTLVRKPNASAIRDALEKGEAVPGANLSNPAPSLTLRTK